MKIGVTPKFGDYNLVFDMLIEKCTGYKMIPCPPITARTIEIGAKHSPDTVCTPFKILLGNFIESIEKGANTLFMPGFGCRLGYYDMLHAKILKDLGYNCDMIALCDYTATPSRIFNSLSSINPDLDREDFDKVLFLVAQVSKDMDEFADLARRNAAFDVIKGSHEKTYKKYLGEARKVKTIEEAVNLGNKYRTQFSDIKTNKPKDRIRIGIVGDMYTVMEPHGNCEMEKWLVSNGVEVLRASDLTFYAKYMFNVPLSISSSGDYVKYNLGGNANSTIMHAYQMASRGEIDGLIHVKAATCSPEISAMTILQDISKDFGLPFMYMTFDTETGEAGVHTRLEAFCDMLQMKKRGKK